MSVIDFKSEKTVRLEAEARAEELIQYVRSNCTQSDVMLEFLDQPFLKKEMAKALHNFKAIENEMNKDKN